MRLNIVLTVSESKRLIAKGVAKLEFVQKARQEGTVAIAKGSTNGYVVEEILGKPIEKHHYMTGATFPAKLDSAGLKSGKIPDVVIKQGEVVEGLAAVDAVPDMKAGDVFMKGANALNYAKRQAGILIGHPTGGTIGATIGTITARRIHLVIPVGLEKNIPTDLIDARDALAEDVEIKGGASTLWPVYGDLVTEIEALQALTGVDAIAVAAGGIGGAEGAIRLYASGTSAQIEQTAELIDSIQGEPPFIEVGP